MSYTKLQYHIVFATKGRRPLLRSDMLARLIKYIGGITRGLNGTLLEANGSKDHLHLAVILHAETAVSDFVRDVKAGSSRWIHQTFPDMQDFAWQAGYSCFSVSYSGLADVVEYIRKQAEHHRTISFKDELTAMLKRHEIEFDERYI